MSELISIHEGLSYYGQYPDIFYEKMSNFIESRLTKSDHREILKKFCKPLVKYYMKYSFQKCDKLLSSDDFLEVFKDNNILNNNQNFDTLWGFFVNNTNHEQQKELLKQSNTCEKEICYPVGLLFGFHFKKDSFIYNLNEIVDKIQKIYETYFDETELQEYILSHSSDAIPYIVLTSSQAQFKKILHFLVETFQNNLNLLKEFLVRKIEPTSLNIFELLSSYDDRYGNLQTLSLFLNTNLGKETNGND